MYYLNEIVEVVNLKLHVMSW